MIDSPRRFNCGETENVGNECGARVILSSKDAALRIYLENRFGRFEYIIGIRGKLISAKKEYHCRLFACRYNAWNFECAPSEKNAYNKCDLKDVCIKYHVER